MKEIKIETLIESIKVIKHNDALYVKVDDLNTIITLFKKVNANIEDGILKIINRIKENK